LGYKKFIYVNTAFYPLAEYLYPLLSKRLASEGSYWHSRVKAHQQLPHSGAFLEARWWVERIEYLREHLSQGQITEILQQLPEREVSVMWQRSQGRRCKDVAQELGVNVTLVKTWYGRGLKRCFTFLLGSQKPDLEGLIYSPGPKTFLNESRELCAASQRIWQVADVVVRQRLGQGTKVVLARLKPELAHLDPGHLDAQIEQWLSHNFSEVVAAQFRSLLGSTFVVAAQFRSLLDSTF
jgi:hypothetical protein